MRSLFEQPVDFFGPNYISAAIDFEILDVIVRYDVNVQEERPFIVVLYDTDAPYTSVEIIAKTSGDSIPSGFAYIGGVPSEKWGAFFYFFYKKKDEQIDFSEEEDKDIKVVEKSLKESMTKRKKDSPWRE